MYFFISVSGDRLAFSVGAGCGPVDEGELCGDAEGARDTRQGSQPPRELVPLQLHHRRQRFRGMCAGGSVLSTAGTGFCRMSVNGVGTLAQYQPSVHSISFSWY